MKHSICLIVVLSAFLFASCGDTGFDVPASKILKLMNEESTVCSMDCSGKLTNNPEYKCVLLDYNSYDGGQLQCIYNPDTKSCEINTDNCTKIEPIESVEVGPREECNGLNLVCETEYSCVGMLQGTLRLCLQECKGDSTACGAGNYCDTSNTVWDSEAVCWGVSGPDGTCLPGATSEEGACTGDSAECIPNGIGMGHECKTTCSGENVDKQGLEGGCDGNDWCLADQSGYTAGLEYQNDSDGQPLDCSEDATLCDEAKKYQCQDIRQGTQTKTVCARPAGRCGTKLTALSSFGESDLQLGGSLNNTQFCNYLGKSQYCEGYSELEGVNAKVECTSLSWGYRLTNPTNQPFPCSNSVDCSIRGAQCINWTQGAACGHIASVCVSYCENFDGTESYTCPANQICGEPETRIAFIREQGEDGNTLGCANGGACGDGYTCTTFSDGDFCIRFRKVCRDIPDDPCAVLDCGSNGACVDTAGTASCECATGYAGTACGNCAEGYLDDGSGACVLSCALDCGLNGICDNTGGTAVCICDNGFGGDTCGTCAEGFAPWADGCSPCPAELACNSNGACGFNDVGTYTCTCDVGYAGDSCATCDTEFIPSLIDSTACIADPCLNETCTGNGTCGQATDDSAMCACTGSFNPATMCECATNESFVEIAGANYCADDPCLEATPCSGQGQCTSTQAVVNLQTSLVKSCACNADYLGDTCQFSDAITCNANGTVDAVGACTCATGYAGATCQFSDAITCNANGTVDAVGTCACAPEWAGDAICNSCGVGYHDDNGACVLD